MTNELRSFQRGKPASPVGGLEFVGTSINEVVVVQAVNSAGGSRFYVQPREGNTDAVGAALKSFADPYLLDNGTISEYYRDVTVHIDTSAGVNGAGRAEFQAKGRDVDNFWSPEVAIGHADLVSPTSAGFRSIYYDPDQTFFNAQPYRPQKAYSVNDVVHASNRFYRCTVAGTTAGTVGDGSTAPTHESQTTATDGTVTWLHLETLSSSGFRAVACFADLDELPPSGITGLKLWSSGSVAMYQNEPIAYMTPPSAGQQASEVLGQFYYDGTGRWRMTLETGGSEDARYTFARTFFQVPTRINQTRQTATAPPPEDAGVWDISDLGGHVMINTTGGTVVNGFSGGTNNDIVRIHNVNAIEFAHGGTASAGTRIQIPGSSNLVLPARCVTEFILETSWGWVPVGYS